MAEYWKAIEPDHEQKELFAALLRMLDGSSEPARLQSAYYLSLLRDPRSEPAVARTFQSVLEGRLAARRSTRSARFGRSALLRMAKRAFRRRIRRSRGRLNSRPSIPTTNGKKLSWQELKADGGRFDVSRLSASGGGSCYLFFRLQSGTSSAGVAADRIGGGLESLAQRPTHRRERQDSRPGRRTRCDPAGRSTGKQ